MPDFPHFKTFELSDRELWRRVLEEYRPQTSEWTFTNLYMWRDHYTYRWSMLDSHLVVIARRGDDTYGLQPLGEGARRGTVDSLLDFLREVNPARPRIERADGRLAAELSGVTGFSIEATDEHFDYVYTGRDLIELSGRRYHAKRNFVNGFHAAEPSARYVPVTPDLIPHCLDLTDRWCHLLPCEEDMNLKGEWRAAREALTNFATLGIQGGAYLVKGGVEAYSLGEMLNPDTAVIHVEKANRDIRGLYAAINRDFLKHQFPDASFVNREQDLGDEGLRRAKSSYFPHHRERKYRVTRE